MNLLMKRFTVSLHLIKHKWRSKETHGMRIHDAYTINDRWRKWININELILAVFSCCELFTSFFFVALAWRWTCRGTESLPKNKGKYCGCINIMSHEFSRKKNWFSLFETIEFSVCYYLIVGADCLSSWDDWVWGVGEVLVKVCCICRWFMGTDWL